MWWYDYDMASITTWLGVVSGWVSQIALWDILLLCLWAFLVYWTGSFQFSRDVMQWLSLKCRCVQQHKLKQKAVNTKTWICSMMHNAISLFILQASQSATRVSQKWNCLFFPLKQFLDFRLLFVLYSKILWMKASGKKQNINVAASMSRSLIRNKVKALIIFFII